MKIIVFAALTLISASAHAINLKSCFVSTTQKGTTFAQTKKVVLASGRANFVRASERTYLVFKLPVSGSNADVYVNDQLNFIFNGNITQGSFESAGDRGTIKCSRGKEVSFVYQSDFVPRTMAPGDRGALGGCYAGDARAAGVDLQQITNAKPQDVSIEPATGTITVSAIERRCVRGRGTNPDDAVCDKYANIKITYNVKNCDYDPDARP